ncbi:hypothetical protein OROMI_014356 [Orobanche minor]
MFSSETISSRDMSGISSIGFNLTNPANPNNFKQVSSAHDEGEFIGLDFFTNENQQQQLNQPSCGLARYKSAPSSFLAALLDPNNTDNSSSGDEYEAFFSALMSGSPTLDLNRTDGSSSCNSSRNDGSQMQYHVIKKEDILEARPGIKNGPGYEGDVNNGGGGCIVGSYNNANNGNNSSSLVRQSSSPAGFLNGFGVMGELGNYRVQNHPKANNSSAKGHINFSSSSRTRFMPTIPENTNQDIGTHNPENGQLRSGDDAVVGEFKAALPHDSWNDSLFSNSLKRNRDGEIRMFSNFNGLDNQDGESRKKSTGSVHHLTSSEMIEVEKLLQFQSETVPCQVRAKRGCATHPRSIAERVRRTRISEKMKKLQDLFPDMEKLLICKLDQLLFQITSLKVKQARLICWTWQLSTLKTFRNKSRNSRTRRRSAFVRVNLNRRSRSYPGKFITAFLSRMSAPPAVAHCLCQRSNFMCTHFDK